MPQPVQLVVFDLGQVLIRVCHTWGDACRNAGLEIDVEEIVGENKAKYAAIVKDWDSGRTTLEQFAEQVAMLGTMRADHVFAATNAFLLGPFPGTEKLLADLKSRGIKTACLSNTNPTHWTLMQDKAGANYCWLDRLDHRFASHLFGKCKPDQAIYEHVEQQTQIAPEAILFFDDKEENVIVARGRGWKAFHIDIHADPTEQVRGELKRHGLMD